LRTHPHRPALAIAALVSAVSILAARGESPAAFGRRCIPADCVAPPSNIPDIAPHRAQDAQWGPRSAVVAPLRRGPHGADCAPWCGSAGRLAALGATPDSHHGLLAAAGNPQQAFARQWEGRKVVVKQTLYTLVYNERGRLGKFRGGRRDGLTVVTPFKGTYFQFDGRQGRDAVVEQRPQAIVDAVADTYQADVLDMQSSRKVEPVSISRYDAGVEFVISRVRVDHDAVRLAFAQTGGVTGDEDPVTSLTVKWPVPLSRSFTERDPIETLIRRFVEVVDAKPAT
jgi:hypothetical protein